MAVARAPGVGTSWSSSSSFEAGGAGFADVFADLLADFVADFLADFFAGCFSPFAAASVFAADFSRAIAGLVSAGGVAGVPAPAAALLLGAAGGLSGAPALRFRFFGSGIDLSVQEQSARGCVIHIVHGNQDDVVRVNFSAGSRGVQRCRLQSGVLDYGI